MGFIIFSIFYSIIVTNLTLGNTDYRLLPINQTSDENGMVFSYSSETNIYVSSDSQSGFGGTELTFIFTSLD